MAPTLVAEWDEGPHVNECQFLNGSEERTGAILLHDTVDILGFDRVHNEVRDPGDGMTVCVYGDSGDAWDENMT